MEVSFTISFSKGNICKILRFFHYELSETNTFVRDAALFTFTKEIRNRKLHFLDKEECLEHSTHLVLRDNNYHNLHIKIKN